MCIRRKFTINPTKNRIWGASRIYYWATPFHNLFIIQSTEKLHVVQFADNTCLFMENKNKKPLADLMNSELIEVSDWLVAN